MRAVEAGEEWALKSPKDDVIQSTIAARDLWIRILTARVETGEPYLLFIDKVNAEIPQHQKLAGMRVKMSNLCSEITLPTGEDRLGNERTAVCCLSSLNLETSLPVSITRPIISCPGTTGYLELPQSLRTW
ncbi:hypothetical protein [Mesonia mobilis]|uniref:hypothetical protein n=1 Tax=Mesonia mobilis TaxID=369791 RepID=UPI0026F02854|nr:hypothetical protein [Mesonia mobilis]